MLVDTPGDNGAKVAVCELILTLYTVCFTVLMCCDIAFEVCTCCPSLNSKYIAVIAYMRDTLYQFIFTSTLY